MYRSAMRPAWVEINLAALKHNIEQIRDKIGPEKKIIGVVKADAYGHGALNIADALKDNGIDSFAVATLPEATALRKHFEETFDPLYESEQEEILVLGLVPDMFADIVAEYDLTPVVCDYENAKVLDAAGAALGKTVSVLIAVDTGMGRIGYVIPDENTEAVISEIVSEVIRISELPNIRIAGVISHMSTADEADKTFANLQTKKYEALCDALKTTSLFTSCDGNGGKAPFLTLANSAGIMELEDTYFDAVRPGIILYGCYPSDEVDKSIIDLEPVMSVKAVIKHLKEVPPGFSVGYGRKFISDRPSKIATLGIGYADGYPRRYSTMGPEQSEKPLPCVIVNGRYAPLAGKICMDQCMIDVTDVPDVKVGDEVIIMGNGSGKLSVTADDIASSIGTINYEVLCSFALRLPRIYKYFK